MRTSSVVSPARLRKWRGALPLALCLAALGALLVGCGFEPSITPVDWGETSEAPDFGVVTRESQVQDAIDAGDYQGAIDLAIELYGIDTSSVNGEVTYNPDLEGVAITHEDGSVEVGDGFFDSPGLLASVIGHEMVHTEQLAEGRWYFAEQGIILNEVEAYDWELDNAAANGLTETEIEEVQTLRGFYYDLLTEDNRALADAGIYELPLPAAATPVPSTP